MPTTSRLPAGLVVVHRRTLRSHGVSNARVRTALTNGRWQEPVRGVVVGHSGGLSQRERWLVALELAGPGAALSHHSALLVWGARAAERPAARRVSGVRGEYVPVPEGGMVEVTRSHGQHMASHGFVVVHQSRRPLEAQVVDGLRVTAPARAVVDAAVASRRRADVDHVVADALQRRLVTPEQLVVEAQQLGRRVTPWLRAALADAQRGMRSVGEADLRRVVVAAGLPEPEWNAAVETGRGTAFVDALWRERGVGAEADGRAWHLGAAEWADDLRRQNALLSTGLVLLRFPVVRLRQDAQACGVELRALVA